MALTIIWQPVFLLYMFFNILLLGELKVGLWGLLSVGFSPALSSLLNMENYNRKEKSFIFIVGLALVTVFVPQPLTIILCFSTVVQLFYRNHTNSRFVQLSCLLSETALIDFVVYNFLRGTMVLDTRILSIMLFDAVINIIYREKNNNNDAWVFLQYITLLNILVHFIINYTGQSLLFSTVSCTLASITYYLCIQWYQGKLNNFLHHFYGVLFLTLVSIMAYTVPMQSFVLLNVSQYSFAIAVVLLIHFGLLHLMATLATPSRTFQSTNTVGHEYDNWTEEGILEYFWGEHVHLGYYPTGKAEWTKDEFKNNKVLFTEKLIEFADIKSPKHILDVGCGIGGTSRWLARKYPEAQVIGITLSQAQVNRATKLAENIPNVKFMVMNALQNEFPDCQFDFIVACESTEHMDDKLKLVQEVHRCLSPGGTFVLAAWCQRDTPPDYTEDEKRQLQYLYDEWAHPHFLSMKEYKTMLDDIFGNSTIDNWSYYTNPSWKQTVMVGVYDPLPVLRTPFRVWWKTIRDMYTIWRMNTAFHNGLMQYGIFSAVKKSVVSVVEDH